jgi:V/A-type H+/Na+-transporting ATPase subunit G/H
VVFFCGKKEKAGEKMAVDAIRLLQEAEQFAETKNKEAEADKKQLSEERSLRLKSFQEELAEQEVQQKALIKEKIAAELIQSKEPLLEKTQAEVKTLRTIPDSLKEEALAIIINKVVT